MTSTDLTSTEVTAESTENSANTAASRRRASRQRSAVEAFLAGQETFRTAQEIHAQLREQGTRVGLATVYRALQAMVDDGEVDVLRTDDGEAAYRRCGPNHHHHLVCRRCGHTV